MFLYSELEGLPLNSIYNSALLFLTPTPKKQKNIKNTICIRLLCDTQSSCDPFLESGSAEYSGTSRGRVTTSHSGVTAGCHRVSRLNSAGAPKCWRTRPALAWRSSRLQSRCPDRNNTTWQEMDVMYQPANLLTQRRLPPGK